MANGTGLQAFLKESGSRVEHVSVFDGRERVQLRQLVLPQPARLLSWTHDWWAERADDPTEPEHVRQFYRTASDVVRFWEATRRHHPGRKGPRSGALRRQIRAEEWKTGKTARRPSAVEAGSAVSRQTVWPLGFSTEQIRLAMDDDELARSHRSLLDELKQRSSPEGSDAVSHWAEERAKPDFQTWCQELLQRFRKAEMRIVPKVREWRARRLAELGYTESDVPYEVALDVDEEAGLEWSRQLNRGWNTVRRWLSRNYPGDSERFLACVKAEAEEFVHDAVHKTALQIYRAIRKDLLPLERRLFLLMYTRDWNPGKRVFYLDDVMWSFYEFERITTGLCQQVLLLKQSELPRLPRGAVLRVAWWYYLAALFPGWLPGTRLKQKVSKQKQRGRVTTEVSLDATGDVPAPEEGVDAAVYPQDLIRRAGLTDFQERVFRAHFCGMTAEDIATEFGVPEAEAASALLAAQARLAELYREDESDSV